MLGRLHKGLSGNCRLRQGQKAANGADFLKFRKNVLAFDLPLC